MKRRCAVCGKLIGKRGFQAPDGAVFDSPECLERYDPEHSLRALRNGIRVMRNLATQRAQEFLERAKKLIRRWEQEAERRAQGASKARA